MIWLCDKETPQLKDTGKLQNSFDIWIGKIMTKFISRYHCTSHQFSKTVPTVHNFSIWFLTVKSGLFFSRLQNWEINDQKLPLQKRLHLIDLMFNQASCSKHFVTLCYHFTHEKKYLTMWFWTLNLRSRILGYQVKKKLLIE